MRITFLGLRGFPGVQGGVETHVEHLCQQLVEQGCEVQVITRSRYIVNEQGEDSRGVRFTRIWAPKSKSLEAIVHTCLGVIVAAWQRPDILHIQAIGPALLTPLARLFRLKVVVTHHGPDYDRQKWGRFAKAVLRLGEHFGMRWSNRRIVISQVIRELVRDKYGLDSTLIPNGVSLPILPHGKATLKKFGLREKHYILLVGRFVPEKRHLDLFEAFKRAELEGWKLVIVGASDHPDAYMHRVLNVANATQNVVCTGFQGGPALQELYANAGIFVLPSSHEGLPIALLEALSYGLNVLASDIPANREVGLREELYFPLGDIAALSARLVELSKRPVDSDLVEARRSWVAEQYDWKRIGKQTLDLYRELYQRRDNV